MPADDLVLNVKQIAGYPPASNAPPASTLLMQLGGLGGPYVSVSPETLVGTALAQGGDMAISGALSAVSVSGGSLQFSNAAFGVLGAQKACIGDFAANFASLNGVPIATVNDVAALGAATVRTFNGRVGEVMLTVDDIICAAGAPIFSPVFQGEPRAGTPPPWSNSNRLATTAFVQSALTGIIEGYAPLDSPAFTGIPTAPTPAQGSSDGSLATTAFVMTAVADSTTGVVSFNGRTGLVVLGPTDISGASGALLASPAFTGVPAAPTAVPGTATAQLATCAFVAAAVAAATAGVASFNGRTGVVTLTSADVAAVGVSAFNGRIGSVNLIANDVSAVGAAMLNSPNFIGMPTAPTAAPGSTTTQLATCAFVTAAIALVSGVTSFNGRTGVVTLALADVTSVGGAPLASPVFTGVPAAPTAAGGTSTTQLATCAFVMNAIAAEVAGVASFNGRTGVVSLIANDISGAGGALLASPVFTGVPAAPTAAPGVSTTQLATCAFVAAAIAAAAGGVTTFNGRSGAVTLTTADVSAAGGPYLALAGGTLTGALNGVAATFSGVVTVANNLISSTGALITRASGAGTANLFLQDNTGTNRSAVTHNPATSTLTMQNIIAASTASIGADGTFSISNATAYKPGGGTWTAPSDARIKTVDGDYEDGLNEVLRLRPVVFRYKGNDAATGERSLQASSVGRELVGLVGQEAETVFPRMVTKRRGWVDGVEIDDLRDLDVTPLIYALINAVKTLAARVAALESQPMEAT